MPYRKDRIQDVAERPEVGPVAEMVRQFADPYAFVRELIQNSIDADASSISVRVERVGGVVMTVFRDDGAGMDRTVIEGPLLTLFNSSKEGDSSKIGKYGVGFVSVFAIDPELVEVESTRGGECHRVRLYRDHRYELERVGKRKGSGTSVSLRQGMDSEKLDGHRERLETALLRWCKYAAIPIEFVCVDSDRGQAPSVRRIDGPLAVPAPLFVQTNRNGEHVVVGPSAGSERFSAMPPEPGDPASGKPTFAGLYNRGLTLFETTEPLLSGLEGVRFRVDSPHLRHTLSRDNVIRDRAFHRVISQVRDIIRGSLRREVSSRLARAAQDLAKTSVPYDETLVLSYSALLETACHAPIGLARDEIMLPLVAPWEGKRVASEKRLYRRKTLYVASLEEELGRAVSQIDEPVVLAPHSVILSLIAARAPLPGPLSLEKHFLIMREIPEAELSLSDEALCLEAEKALHAAGIRVESVALAQVRPPASSGSESAAPELEMPCLLVQGDVRSVGAGLWLFKRSFAEMGWAKERASGTLLLDMANEAVALARERAKEDSFVAAHLLVRILMLFREDKGGKISDRLFDASTEVLA